MYAVIETGGKLDIVTGIMYPTPNRKVGIELVGDTGDRIKFELGQN